MHIRQTLKSIADGVLHVMQDDPDKIAQKEKLLDEAITSIVNLRTPNIDPNSDEFDERYDEVLDEVSAMYQGKQKFMLINAQELLNTEQKTQGSQLHIVR